MPTTATKSRPGAHIGPVFVDAISADHAVETIIDWAKNGKPGYVVLCNVHVAMTARSDSRLLAAVEQANLILPDGAPIAWMLRRMGFANQTRVAGPDLMARVMQRCADESIPVYLFGGSPETLGHLRDRIQRNLPAMPIAGSESPPYRPLTKKENQLYADKINGSRSGIVFVGLGCPKQEQWMLENTNKINATLIGVGAAFDFLAGSQTRAPIWMQRLGLEWLHRLLSEPRRLWRRYLVTNTQFIFLACHQLLYRWLR